VLQARDGVMHFVRSGTVKVGLTEVQCGEAEKCVGGQSRTKAAMVVIERQCDCHCVDRVI